VDLSTFLLVDENQNPIVVLEAKKESLNPLVGKEQARNYAKSQKVKFIILSNGTLHYLWNIETGNPEQIQVFPTLDLPLNNIISLILNQ
jgi:type I restriction enzyme R subunit